MTNLSLITNNISIIPKKLSIISIKYIEPIMQTLLLTKLSYALFYDIIFIFLKIVSFVILSHCIIL